MKKTANHNERREKNLINRMGLISIYLIGLTVIALQLRTLVF